MPDMYVAMEAFEIQRNDFAAPEASGRIGGVQSGFPLWSCVWTLSRMPQDNSDEWRAWVSGMRGQTRRFIGRPISRPLPKAYMESGLPGGFDGEASGWSENINADGDSELTLTGLPVGLVLGQGDYIDFRWTATEDAVSGLPWRAIVRVVEGATANGGGSATVIVEPPVPAAVPVDAEAHLDEPGCIMALVLDQTSVGPVDRLYAIREGQIAGIQDIRA
jgi:hypothetical protein